MDYLINPQHMLLNNFTASGEGFSLPERTRIYLDCHSDEFNSISIERKICHLGVVVAHGLNLYSVFKAEISRHQKDPRYPGFENNAKLSLLGYIAFLREQDDDLKFLADSTDSKKLVDVLTDELLLRYREYNCNSKNNLEVSFVSIPIDYKQIESRFDMETSEGTMSYYTYLLTSQETLENVSITEDYLKSFSRWKNVGEKLKGYNLYFDEDIIYPGDERLVLEYNVSQKQQANQQLILRIPPEPWTGNILNAKLVLLSMNPGYVEHLNKSLANMFRNSFAEEIMEDKRRVCMMDGYKFDYYEPTRILGAYYWRKNISPLGIAVYNKQKSDKIFEQVALCQFLAYSSTKSVNLKELLPSQIFTKIVLFHLATAKKEVKFLVMRAENQWKTLMGEGLWNYLFSHNRLLISEHYRNQSLSEKNIGHDNFHKIVTFLKASKSCSNVEA